MIGARFIQAVFYCRLFWARRQGPPGRLVIPLALIERSAGDIALELKKGFQATFNNCHCCLET